MLVTIGAMEMLSKSEFREELRIFNKSKEPQVSKVSTRVFISGYCGVVFVNKEIIKAHIHGQHDGGRREGVHCAKTATGKVKSLWLKLCLHEEKGLLGLLCGKIVLVKANLRLHKLRIHDDGVLEYVLCER